MQAIKEALGIIAFVICLIALNGCRKPEGRVEQDAAQLITNSTARVGGVAVLEADADAYFKQYSGGNTHLFSLSDEKQFRTLSSFALGLDGEVLGIWPGSDSNIGEPAQIRIRFGAHSDSTLVFITQTNSADIRGRMKSSAHLIGRIFYSNKSVIR